MNIQVPQEENLLTVSFSCWTLLYVVKKSVFHETCQCKCKIKLSLCLFF